MRVLASLVLALASVDAATRVAVIELGNSGTVRRTTAANEQTSAEGVASFWSALHGYGRKLQHAGMTVVPDMFSRPESGVVVGLTGVDLDNMPNLNSFMTSEENGVVGHMEVHGQACQKMMRNVKNVEQVQHTTLSSAFESQASQAGISGLKMDVTTDNASDVDMQLAALLHKANEEAQNSGKTVVLHLVVEEDDGAARRRRLARRLQEDGEEGEGEGEGQEGGEQDQGEQGEGNNNQNNGNNGNNQNNGNNGNGQNNYNNGYYGYGYYNSYNEWVTPYKTMFQIQYFNVVLWTSIGLVGTLFFSLYLFVYMPLMADTLLFGESAKVAHDD
mmetsp:Transcript_71160/g.206077  ORF Transcript_71160/g.206077 Transcript_71160/m.206077 type:complete len:331 (+) Transcript_71160:56-1048(+)